MIESELQKIIRKTGRKPIQCKCQKCKDQCKTPCLGTPADIWTIIQAGYGSQLMRSYWIVGLLSGCIDYPVTMVQAQKTGSGCIFWKDGLCRLHDNGLKPTEGKLSHHTLLPENYKFSKSLSWNVAREWIAPENKELVKKILDLYPESDLKIE